LKDWELFQEFGPKWGFAVLGWENEVRLSDGRPAQRIVAGWPRKYWEKHESVVEVPEGVC
jgi:hypothetical protein